MYAAGYAITVPPMVGVFTQHVGWMNGSFSASRAASATYEAANLAVYYPLILPAPCVARRVWWANGATVAGGATIEVGIYSDSGYGPGAKIVSGSATQGTANEVQYVDVTDTVLAPGLIWIAISSSSATNTTLFRVAGFGGTEEAGLRFQQSSASPLPATATPVESSGTNIYLCGFATTASP